MRQAGLGDYESAIAIAEKAIVELDLSCGEAIDVDVVDPGSAYMDGLEADMDGWDVLFCCASAAASALITTSEELERWLAEVHDAASGSSGDYDFLQRLLASLLRHKGDDMDIMTTRTDDDPWRLFHRLFWGHDPLSARRDNPFALMISQRGPAGALQAVRHLIADTFSKQGLPVPGHSCLDYTRDDGRVWNHLLDLVQELAKEAYDDKRYAEPIYEHLLTVRAQDAAGGMMSMALCSGYLALRNVGDEVRAAQIRLTSYTMSFFAEALVGAARQNGVPYVNVPLGAAMAKSYAGLLRASGRRTGALELETGELEARAGDLVGRHGSLKALLADEGIGSEMGDGLHE